MLHFLPELNKKQITLEYLLRVFIFLFIFVLVAFVFLISMFLPSVIFATYKNTTVKAQLASTHIIDKEKGEDPVLIIKNVNAMVSVLLNKDASGIGTSDIIKKIVSLKNQDIQILNIDISESTATSKTIVLRGISKRRDNLTAYRDNLLSGGMFSRVDLPVANLIQDTDNNFVITLTYTYVLSQ